MSAPHDTRTFTFSPSRWAKGRLAIHLGPRPESTAGSIMKDRAAWMLEALNAYYSHRAGLCLTPAQAEKFSLLYRAGFWSTRRLLERDKTPCTYSLPDGPELPLKAALVEARRILSEPGAPAAPLIPQPTKP